MPDSSPEQTLAGLLFPCFAVLTMAAPAALLRKAAVGPGQPFAHICRAGISAGPAGHTEAQCSLTISPPAALGSGLLPSAGFS